jgi:formate hydrogenlyase subunit 3/multisubunit Na+/H+ antiporter MnhD subunit
MPVIDVFIVAAIVTAFIFFGVVLAWAEYQTRHLAQAAQPQDRQAAKIQAKAA